jgi:hypothetical protein
LHSSYISSTKVTTTIDVIVAVKVFRNISEPKVIHAKRLLVLAKLCEAINSLVFCRDAKDSRLGSSMPPVKVGVFLYDFHVVSGGILTDDLKLVFG